MPEAKKPVLLRLDRDVLDFFRRGGRGYQTRINTVRRSYVTSQQDEGREGRAVVAGEIGEVQERR